MMNIQGSVVDPGICRWVRPHRVVIVLPIVFTKANWTKF